MQNHKVFALFPDPDQDITFELLQANAASENIFEVLEKLWLENLFSWLPWAMDNGVWSIQYGGWCMEYTVWSIDFKLK